MSELTEGQLKGVDAVVIVDHSGSMGEASIRAAGKTRMEELEEDVTAIARIAEKYDADGLTVIAFSSAVKTYDKVTAQRVKEVFKEFPPRGSTNLAGALEAGVKKAQESGKSTVVLAFTDGVPDDKAAVVSVIKEAATKLGRPKIGFCIVQVGNDDGATKFLKELDEEMKGAPDIVDTVSAKEAEALTYQQLAWRALND